MFDKFEGFDIYLDLWEEESEDILKFCFLKDVMYKFKVEVL